jgi:mono/diheme cytochrome c family protein
LLIRSGSILAAWLALQPVTAEAGSEADTAADSGGAEVCEGVYSLAQAQRGQSLFASHCVECHGTNFRGGFGVASLVGPAFNLKWRGKTLFDLFTQMKTTMPLNRAGSLTDGEYAEIVARILEANGYPAVEGADISPEREELEKLALPARCPGP